MYVSLHHSLTDMTLLPFVYVSHPDLSIVDPALSTCSIFPFICQLRYLDSTCSQLAFRINWNSFLYFLPARSFFVYSAVPSLHAWSPLPGLLSRSFPLYLVVPSPSPLSFFPRTCSVALSHHTSNNHVFYTLHYSLNLLHFGHSSPLWTISLTYCSLQVRFLLFPYPIGFLSTDRWFDLFGVCFDFSRYCVWHFVVVRYLCVELGSPSCVSCTEEVAKELGKCRLLSVESTYGEVFFSFCRFRLEKFVIRKVARA